MKGNVSRREFFNLMFFCYITPTTLKCIHCWDVFFKNMHCRGSNEDKVDVQMKTFSWHSNLIIVTSLVEVLCYLLLHFTQMAVKNKSIS